MYDLAAVWILVYVLFIRATIARIIYADKAEEFLGKVDIMPQQPGKVALISYFLLAGLILVMHFSHKSRGGVLLLFFYYLLESLIVTWLMQQLNFNFNEILLMIIVDLLAFDCGMQPKVLLSIVTGLYYLLAEVRGFGFMRRSIRLDVYLNYYKGWVRTPVSFFESGYRFLFFVLTLVYIVITVRTGVEETQRIAQLNRELDATNTSLHEANERLREYALTAESIAETRERNRLAREIHDTLGHTLTGIISSLDACMTLIRISPDATREQLEKTQKVAREGMKDVRRSVNALRPDKLERFSLDDALRQMTDEMKGVSGAEITLEEDLKGLKTADDEAEAIYRIVQEGVTNSLRHGEADRIQIRIQRNFGEALIEVRDNGKGCSDVKPGFGLKHMQERLDLLHGSLRYENLENGFLVIARIPLRWGNDEA